MSQYKPYSSYKHSGVEWLGRVPSHWHVKRLKDVALCRNSNVDKKSYEGEQPVELCNYTDVYYNEKITDSISFMRATAKREDVLRFSLKSGDVIITKDSESADDIGIPALVAESASGVVCGYHLTLIRPQEAIHGNYLFRVLCSFPSSTQFYLGASGVTRYGLGKGTIDGLLFSIPPLEEQQAIATFLDRETARIDALIEKKQRQIELLKEKRQAIITQAVTKGLDPDVPMKDSGVEWLGEVPEHWEVAKLKRLSSLIGGYAFSSEDFIERGIQLLRIGNVYLNRLSLERQPVFLPAEYLKEFPNFVIRQGDVIASMTGTLGKRDYGYAVIIDKEGPFFLNQRVCKFNINEKKVTKEMFLNIIQSEAYLAQLYSLPFGTKQANLGNDDILNIYAAYPVSISEQERICSWVNETLKNTDYLIDKCSKAIELLLERRSALITAAVTGQIDVREEV